MLKFLRIDRCLKDGLQNVPVISILMNQMIHTLQEQNIMYSESVLKDIQNIYKGVSKRGLQTFFSTIPARNASNTIYIRCLQIFKSALSESTLHLLESGM